MLQPHAHRFQHRERGQLGAGEQGLAGISRPDREALHIEDRTGVYPLDHAMRRRAEAADTIVKGARCAAPAGVFRGGWMEVGIGNREDATAVDAIAEEVEDELFAAREIMVVGLEQHVLQRQVTLDKADRVFVEPVAFVEVEQGFHA